MAYLTDRKRAQGLGSAHSGTKHHWEMMGTSMALLFVAPAFLLAFGAGLGGTFEEVQAYFGRPGPALITAICLVVGLYHLKAEVVAAVEDYIHGVAGKLTLIGVTALTYVLMGAGLFALAKLAL